MPGTAASIQARRASPVASVAADRLDEIDATVTVISTSDAEAIDETAGLFEGASVDVVDKEDLVESIPG